MLNFFARHRSAIAGAGLAALAFGLILSSREGSFLLGRPVGLVGAPVQAEVRGIAGGLAAFTSHYVLLAGARQDAERLRREVADLKRELLAVDEVALENRRLKTLLNFKESTDLPLLPARVVGRSASAWFRTLVLDKGSDEGIQNNCPVVTAEGVIGRVCQVEPSSSRVLLITDTSSAIDALVQRTRAQLIVEGRLGPRCRVQYLARTDEAALGDRVVTSGLGDVFPKGLLLGEISAVERGKGGVFRAAELKPSADVSRLEEVFVVLSRGRASP